jgi:hypothetical protein
MMDGHLLCDFGHVQPFHEFNSHQPGQIVHLDLLAIGYQIKRHLEESALHYELLEDICVAPSFLPHLELIGRRAPRHLLERVLLGLAYVLDEFEDLLNLAMVSS